MSDKSQNQSNQIPEDVQNILLTEYRMAQQSAEHHDNFVWSVTSIVWGSLIVLLGFVIQTATNKELLLYQLTASVLGICLLCFIWYHVYLLNNWKVKKYIRCKHIEEKLGMKQHLQTYPRRAGYYLYQLMMIGFLVAWIIVILLLLFL